MAPTIGVRAERSHVQYQYQSIDKACRTTSMCSIDEPMLNIATYRLRGIGGPLRTMMADFDNAFSQDLPEAASGKNLPKYNSFVGIIACMAQVPQTMLRLQFVPETTGRILLKMSLSCFVIVLTMKNYSMNKHYLV